jgi:hypothetical protein
VRILLSPSVTRILTSHVAAPILDLEHFLLKRADAVVNGG